jgi:Xaa-Pro aminopeptidase
MHASDVHSARIRKLREILKGKKVDAFLAISLDNIFYLTGFTGSSGILYVGKNDATLFTDSRYSLQTKTEVKEAKVAIYENKKQFLDNLKKLKGNLIGFTSNNITHRQYNSFKKNLKGSKLKDLGAVIEGLRQIKDQHELKIIKSAIKKAEKSLDETFLTLKEGDSELDIKNRLEGRIRENGCEKESFDTIVVAGRNSALIHGRPSTKKIKKGDLLLIDYGVRYKNYCTDKTCTVVLGEPKVRQRKIFDIVMEAKRCAIAGLKDGVSSKHIYSLAMDYINKNGYGKYFLHGLGHGVGIQVHEPPMLSPVVDSILKEGMIITIEPGIYIENFGGIRLEDMVYITKTGSKILTKSQISINF